MVDQRKIISTGAYEVGESPQIFSSYGIGSCVVVCLYDKAKRFGGLIHAMLPEQGTSQQSAARFVDSGIIELVSKLNSMGVKSEEMEAKLIGGAHMFQALNSSDRENLGERNVKAAERVLGKLGIKIDSEDIGGSVGRSVEFDLQSGVVKVVTKM